MGARSGYRRRMSLAAAAIGLSWSLAGSALGACAALSPRLPGARTQAALLGFAAGVMLAASLLSLLPQALDAGGSLSAVVGGLLGGIALIALLDRMVPHQHPGAPAPDHARGLTRGTALLIALALTLHNIPEGMAVGIAAAHGELAAAGTVVAAIAIHNVIEGVLVAVPLRLSGMSALRAFAIGQVAGAAEFLAGLTAALVIGDGSWLIPAGLACAAGAMVFLVLEELYPEAVRLDAGNIAPLGATAGVVLVVMLKALGA